MLLIINPHKQQPYKENTIVTTTLQVKALSYEDKKLAL